MTDREKYLTILDRFYRGRGGSLLTKDECEAMEYAISSIKTDLKYDLLYEETNHIANVSKMIEPTPDDCETCIHNKGVLECDMYGCKYESTTKNDLADGKDNNVTSKEDAISRQEAIDTIRQLYIDLATQKYVIDILKVLPSVTPQTRQGHWIPVFQGDEIIDYRCSCCEFGNTFGKGTVGMNYCPRCGSRNEVEE